MKAFYSITCLFWKGVFSLFHAYRVYGLEHFVPGAAIIAPNHASYYDPPLVAVSWPEEIHFLAREGLFRKPLLKIIISNLNTYPVRGNSTDLTTFKTVFKLLKENKKVVIFPEGNRTEDGQLGPIKSGIGMLALRGQCPIIPTYIHGTFEVWPRSKRFPKLWGKIACVFGEPIYPGKFSSLPNKSAQEAIANEVKNSIENLRIEYLHFLAKESH